MEVYAKVINIPIKINKMSKTFLHYSCSKVSLQIKCNQSGDYKLYALRAECLRLKLCPSSQDWDMWTCNQQNSHVELLFKHVQHCLDKKGSG